MELLTNIIRRTIKKFGSAFEGVLAGVRYDRSILIQIILALIALVFFITIGISAIEWLFVLSAVFCVLITEFLNSAVEDICDLLVKEYSLHVKEIKDIAAAAVLFAAIYASLVGIIIIYGRFV